MNERDLAAGICRTLRASGHQAFLVGGCVRDLLLGREPEDYDVATDARPERVQELFPCSVDVGARFGVILVLEPGVVEQKIVEQGALGQSVNEKGGVEKGAQVEVATFRSDVGYSDGRHPDRVEYSRTPEEDVRRRDFTINGLMLDPETHEVLDFVGGRADLEAGIVRAIGDPWCAFARTSCAWFARCALRRDSATPSSPTRSRQSKPPRRRSPRSRPSDCATN